MFSWLYNTVADVLFEPEDPTMERKDIEEISQEWADAAEETRSPLPRSAISATPAESMGELEFKEQRSELIRTFSFDERPPIILTGVNEGVELIVNHDLAEKVRILVNSY